MVFLRPERGQDPLPASGSDPGPGSNDGSDSKVLNAYASFEPTLRDFQLQKLVLIKFMTKQG